MHSFYCRTKKKHSKNDDRQKVKESSRKKQQKGKDIFGTTDNVAKWCRMVNWSCLQYVVWNLKRIDVLWFDEKKLNTGGLYVHGARVLIIELLS